jgi:hypothetical protein
MKAVGIRQNSHHEILKAVEGQVFHVTKESNWTSILESGKLIPNQNGNLATSFGSSKNSFFRLRGCVSFFDWRENPTEEIEDFRRRCWPFQSAVPGGEGVVFMIAKKMIQDRLLSWKRWEEEKAWGKMIVPYVEAGVHGEISLDYFSDFRLYRREPDPPDSLAAIVSASFRRTSN